MAKHRLGNTQNKYFEIEQPDNAGHSKVTSTDLISKTTPVANRQALKDRVGTFEAINFFSNGNVRVFKGISGGSNVTGSRPTGVVNGTMFF